jgi:hypothetical protein
MKLLKQARKGFGVVLVLVLAVGSGVGIGWHVCHEIDFVSAWPVDTGLLGPFGAPNIAGGALASR